MDTTQEKNNIDIFNKVQSEQGTGKEFISGQGVLPSSSTPNNTTPVINTDLIKSKASPYNLPESKPISSADGIISEITSLTESQKKASQEKQAKDFEIKKLEQEQASKVMDLESVYKDLGLVSNKTIQAEEKAGLPDLQAQEDEYTSQIEAKTLSARRKIEQIQKEGTGGTLEGQRDLINKIEADTAREVADISIAQAVVSRKLDRAKTLIARKVELETEGLKTKAEYLKYIIDNNKDTLDKNETRELNKASKEADRAYEEEKEKKKTLEETRLKYMDIASSLGKGADVISEFQKATSPDQIMSIASRNGVVSLEDQLKTVQIQEKKADIEKTRVEASLILGNSGAKADNLNAYANQYADTGKLPSPAELKQSGLSVGQVTLLAKQTKKPDGALVSTNTGVKSSSLSPAQEDGIVAMSEIVTQTLPSLQEKFPKLYTGLIGGIAGQVFTTQDRQDYLTFRQEFLNKLLKARSGATVTPQEYDRYSKLLPSEFNQSLFLGSDGSKKLGSLATAMKQTLDNSLKSNQLSIYGYSTVPVGGIDRKVGEILDMNGVKLRVLPDGTLTDNI